MRMIPETPEEYRVWWVANTDAPYGYCWCGCGRSTPLALKTNVRHQWFKDEPFRYFHNHHGRKFTNEYTAEDRGHQTPCWISNRTKNEHGYTSMRIDGKMVRTHRVFYERKYGQIPNGRELDHLCRVPACCNPDHLEPVSHRENVRRGHSAKITPEMEGQIVDLLQNRTLRQSDIAAMFGLEQTAISKIWRKHFPFDRNRLRSRVTQEDARKILRLKDSGVRQCEIAQMFGIAETCVSQIVNGKWWPAV